MSLFQEFKFEMFKRQLLSLSEEKLKEKTTELLRLVVEQGNHILFQKQLIRKIEMQNECLKGMVDELQKMNK